MAEMVLETSSIQTPDATDGQRRFHRNKWSFWRLSLITKDLIVFYVNIRYICVTRRRLSNKLAPPSEERLGEDRLTKRSFQ